jgi:hypothetical protein
VAAGTVAENVAGASLDGLVSAGIEEGQSIEKQVELSGYRPTQMVYVGLQNQYSWVQIPFGAPKIQ